MPDELTTKDFALFDLCPSQSRVAFAVRRMIAGHRWGTLAIDGLVIDEVHLHNPRNVAEGVQRFGAVYILSLPAPGALALLGLAGLVDVRRRRASSEG